MKAILALSVAVLLFGLYAWGDHNGAARVQARYDAYVAAQKAEVARVEGEWKAKAAETETKLAKAEASRAQAFAQLRKTIRAYPDSPVPAGVVGVLDSARSEADPAGPATKPDQKASTLAAVAEWMTDVLAIHSECRAMVQGWQAFYQSLR